jgi:hypothetical protein
MRATLSTNTQTIFGESRAGMRDITIANNTIYKGTNWTCPVFRIASADGVLIQNNTIFLGANDNAENPVSSDGDHAWVHFSLTRSHAFLNYVSYS